MNKISVVVSVYNEELSIREFYKAAQPILEKSHKSDRSHVVL